jgi:hypothetical protein
MAKQPSRRVRKALKKYVRGNPRVKLPANWTAAKVRVLPNGDVQVAVNPSKTGRFARGVKRVESRNPKKEYEYEIYYRTGGRGWAGNVSRATSGADAIHKFVMRQGGRSSDYRAVKVTN